MHLDNNPGAYELVRQLLGHKNLKTTTNFYAGIDTRQGRTRSRRPHHEAPRIQVGPAAADRRRSAARGLAPCADCKPRLHLPYGQWPAADRLLWERAMGSDDPFAEAPVLAWPRPRSTPICSHGGGSSGSWRSTNPLHWTSLPAERLTIERVRAFVAHLAETNTPLSVAIQMSALY